jgi:hypothetical protein
MNHAGALGHACDMHDASAQRHLAESHLRDQVGGHDGAGGVGEGVFREPAEQARQRIEDQLGVELDADHAGGSGQH